MSLENTSLTLGHWQALVLLIHGFPLGLWRSFEEPEKAWTSSKPWPFFISAAFVHTVWRELLFPGVLCFGHPLSKLSQEVLSLNSWASCSNCKCIFRERKLGDALGQHAGWVDQPKETCASHFLCRGGAQRVKSNEIGNLSCSPGIAILWGDKLFPAISSNVSWESLETCLAAHPRALQLHSSCCSAPCLCSLTVAFSMLRISTWFVCVTLHYVPYIATLFHRLTE